jgi:hypothetical protein
MMANLKLFSFKKRGFCLEKVWITDHLLKFNLKNVLTCNSNYFEYW